MSGIATAVIAGAVISGVAASKSAKKAAKAQTEAAATGSESVERSTQLGIEEQRRQFDITQQSLAPFQEAGSAALEQQRILLGLGATDPDAARRTDLQSQLQTLQSQAQAEPEIRQEFQPGRGFGQGPSSGFGQFQSGSIAADQRQSEITRIQQELGAIPDPATGTSAEQQQAAFAALEESPGQQFLRDRAQKNLVRNASAIGGLGGGNVRSALVQQGVGFAQQDLQNQFARLGQVAGQGQAAATNVGQFGQQVAGSVSNLLSQQGQAGQFAAQQSGQARATGIQNQSAIQQQAIGQIAGAAGQLFGGSTPPPSSTANIGIV